MMRLLFLLNCACLFPISCLAQLNEPSAYPQKQHHEESMAVVQPMQQGCSSVDNVGVYNNDHSKSSCKTLDEDFGMIWIQVHGSSKKYHVYDSNDVGKVYNDALVKQNCFVVISKQEYRIYVYEKVNKDTLLRAHFPICLARNAERADKYRSGDGTTPHCAKDHNGNYIAFTISQIQPSSTWRHDFKDGRGSILAYGDWFMRLKLNGHRCASNNSIGIHGSSGNELSVPGLDSEGCIRLRNKDLNIFHDAFAHVGMKVIIKPKEAVKLPFEIKAQNKLPNYLYAQKGYPLPPGVQKVKP